MLSWTIPTIAKNGGSVVLTFSVDLDATFPNGTTSLPNVVVVTGPGSNCEAQSEDADCDTDTTVEAAPNLHTVKLVKTNDGSFGPTSTADPGDTLHYQITITNSGDADATDIPVTDDINAILQHATYNDDCNLGCGVTGGVLSWTVDVPANGGSVVLTFSVHLAATFPDGTTTIPNVVVVGAPAPTARPTKVTRTATPRPRSTVFSLVIDKTNDAPLEDLVLPDKAVASSTLPTANEGATVTYTLGYTIGAIDVTNAVITDVVPKGLQYVDGSATNNAEFTFDGYDSTTRTLSWTAAKVTENGSVTYKALVTQGRQRSSPSRSPTWRRSSPTRPSPTMTSSDVFVPVDPAVPRPLRRPTLSGHQPRDERAGHQPDAHPRGPRRADPRDRLRHPGPGGVRRRNRR